MKTKFLLTIVYIFITSCIYKSEARDRDEQKDEALTDKTYSKEYLDTLNLERKSVINDYSMIGVQYGVGINRTLFNPTKNHTSMITPLNIGVFYTKYGKMFRYMPYFGYQIGILYGHDGYMFKPNDKGITPTVDGAVKAEYEFIEVPFMSHFHLDAGYFKIMANLGLYGGYRLSVKRFGKEVKEYYRSNFYDYDRRIDYGIRGGLGFALIFSPIELHITALAKYSMSSLYNPDYKSPYYYRFAYPFDVMISAGVHFQLTKRRGKTKAQLKKEAYDIVYGTSIEEKTDKNIKSIENGKDNSQNRVY